MRAQISAVISICLAVHPLVVNASQTNHTEESLARIRFSDTSRSQQVTQTANIELHHREGKRVVIANLSTASAETNVEVSSNELVFGDGYRLTKEVLVDNQAQTVLKLVALSPQGRHATATVRYNKATQQGDAVGMDRVFQLLSQSAHFDAFLGSLAFLKAGLPNKGRESTIASVSGSFSPESTSGTASLQSLLTDEPPMQSDGWLGCALAMVAVAIVLVEFIAACGAPIVNVLACAPSLVGFVAAGVWAACECSDDSAC